MHRHDLELARGIVVVLAVLVVTLAVNQVVTAY